MLVNESSSRSQIDQTLKVKVIYKVSKGTLKVNQTFCAKRIFPFPKLVISFLESLVAHSQCL